MFKQSAPAPGRDLRDHVFNQIALGALFLFFGYIVWTMIGTAFGWWPVWLVVIFSILSIAYVVFGIVTLWHLRPTFQWGHWVGLYWVGLLGVLFSGCVFFDIIEDIFPHIGIVISPVDAGIFSVVISLFIFGYAVWQSQRALVTSLTVGLPGLPESWQGKTILFVADLHLGEVRGERFAEKVSRVIARVKPEVVFIGGDLFDGRRCDPDALIASLKQYQPPQGIYYVTGNHEYFTDPEQEFLPAVRRAGMHVLRNNVVDLGGVQLTGVDYRDAGSRENFKNILADIVLDPAKPSILLKHVPDHLEIARERGISLVLSGHTHNGQIWPLPYFGWFVKEFYYGHHYAGETQIYVTSGVGTNGAPIRLGTKSEIVAITLEKK